MIEFLSAISDIIGIIGVGIILISYFLLNTERMSSDNLTYPLSNFIGAALILVSLLFNFNLASVLMECAWILISLIGIYRIWLKK
jgi:hypothetical protein